MWSEESRWATVNPASPDPTTATRSLRGGGVVAAGDAFEDEVDVGCAACVLKE